MTATQLLELAKTVEIAPIPGVAHVVMILRSEEGHVAWVSSAPNHEAIVMMADAMRKKVS